MITELTIQNFKCFHDQTFRFSHLNLLTGANSIGKTAVLQALAAVWDAANKDDKTAKLQELTRMEGRDISLLAQREDEDIQISVTNDAGKSVHVVLSKDPNGIGHRTEITGTGVPELKPSAAWHYVPLFAAKDYFGGCSGDASPDLRADGIKTDTLTQCNYWLNEITGMKISQGWDSYVGRGDIPDERIYETGILLEEAGFGLRHTAEIIRVGLTSAPGDTIILEDPEVGLAEGAQSRLYKFLYHLASHGRQVFVETHSVFLFNAMRVATVKGRLAPEDYSVNFLARDKKTGDVICGPVTIGQYGRIWGETGISLEGFFDQYSEDLDAMLGLDLV